MHPLMALLLKKRNEKSSFSDSYSPEAGDGRQSPVTFF